MTPRGEGWGAGQEEDFGGALGVPAGQESTRAPRGGEDPTEARRGPAGRGAQ